MRMVRVERLFASICAHLFIVFLCFSLTVRFGWVYFGAGVCPHQPSTVRIMFCCVFYVMSYFYYRSSLDTAINIKAFVVWLFHNLSFAYKSPTYRASQRTAAVIVLRKLYPSFREETSIVHKYAMRVIHLLCKSMRLYDHAATQQVTVK